MLFAVGGGVGEYMSFIDPKLSVKENARKQTAVRNRCVRHRRYLRERYGTILIKTAILETIHHILEHRHRRHCDGRYG